jgi:hypothetical protein
MREIINSNIVMLFFFILTLEIVLFGFCTYLLFKFRKKQRQIELFLSGRDGKSLEGLIEKNVLDIQALDQEIQEVFNFCNKLHKLTIRSIHKIGLIRFNPFGDIGGDQSFSVALLDGKDCGFIISSLHTKEGTRVYAKPIKDGESQKYQLTEEEKQAIKIASPLKSSQV